MSRIPSITVVMIMAAALVLPATAQDAVEKYRAALRRVVCDIVLDPG